MTWYDVKYFLLLRSFSGVTWGHWKGHCDSNLKGAVISQISDVRIESEVKTFHLFWLYTLTFTKNSRTFNGNRARNYCGNLWRVSAWIQSESIENCKYIRSFKKAFYFPIISAILFRFYSEHQQKLTQNSSKLTKNISIFRLRESMTCFSHSQHIPTLPR